MLAVRFYEFGDPSVLVVEDIARPGAGDGEVLVQVCAATVNQSDVKNVQGAFEKTTLPRTPGRDFAGLVVEGPKKLIGKAVWGTGGDIGFTRDGTHAQHLVLPQDAVYEKPKLISFTEAASVGVSYVTAWSALCETAGVLEEDVVAIVGAHGSVGSAAVQIAKWCGATVIGIVRQAAQRESVLQLGADEAIDTSQDEMREAVMDITGVRGATIVFNTVGGAMFEPCLGLLARRGRQIEITTTTIKRVSFDLRDFYEREARLFGVDTLQLSVSAASAILDRLKSGFESGDLRPPAVSRAFPLEDARQAYIDVMYGAQGKVILLPVIAGE
jgi:NADPH2:quinone reductase